MKSPSEQLLSRSRNHRELGVWGERGQSGNLDYIIVHFCSSVFPWVSDPLGTHMHLVTTSCPLRDPGTEAGTCLLQGFEIHMASSSLPSPSFLLSQDP